MASQAGRRTLSQLWKQGWHEIPDVMVSCCLGVTGLAIGAYGVYWRQTHFDSGEMFRYRHHYIVRRPEDVENPKDEFLYTISK